MKVTPEFIKAIPKSELHVHLDGSLRINTLIDLAKSQKIVLPSYTEGGLQELVFKDQYKDLNEYLTGFAYTTAVMQDEESLERISYELAEDCCEEGIRYLEVRFAPQLHISSKMSIEQILSAVGRGLERFGRSFNAKSSVKSGKEPPFHYGIICCAMRMFNPQFSEFFRLFSEVHRFTPAERIRDIASQELAFSVVDVRDRLGIPIVGFDLAGQEAGYPAEDHVSAFQFAHQHFLKKTVHAGEAYGPESINQAITDLYADRIGHGYHLYSTDLIQDKTITNREKYVCSLANYICDRRITIEVCLTSNRQTMPNLKGWATHSLKKFIDNELSITLCTDNRTVSNTTLSKEIALALEHFDISPRRLKNMVIYGFKRSFFPGAYIDKRKYVRQIIDYYEEVERKFGIDTEPV